MRSLFPDFLPKLPLDRLRDPLVQVWVMAGFSVLLVLIGHLRAWNATGEGKNNYRESASRLLLAGARIEWSDKFGSAHRPKQRPTMNLGYSSLPGKSTIAAFPGLDLRCAMQLAASQPWQAVDRPVRQSLSQAKLPARALRVRLNWTGDVRGNAALVARRLPSESIAAAATFVIGNGSRSGDGQIECLTSGTSFAGGLVDVTLIAAAGRISPRQLAAVAELLVHLEALSGYRVEVWQGGPAQAVLTL